MANFVQFPIPGPPEGRQPVFNGRSSPHSAQRSVDPSSERAEVPVIPGAINDHGFGNPESPPAIRPGTIASKYMKLPDGSMTYVSLVAEMIDGRLQWVTKGGPSETAASVGETVPGASYWDPDRTIERDNSSGVRPLGAGVPTGSRPEVDDTPRRLHGNNDEAFFGHTIPLLDWERELGWAEYGLSYPNTMPFGPFIPPGAINGGKDREIPFSPFIPPGVSNRGEDREIVSQLEPRQRFTRPPRAAYPEPPMAFNREPSKDLPYTRFNQFAIIFDLDDLKKFLPPLPALLVPCDVKHEDWDRCMLDLSTAWNGVLPYDILHSPRKQRSRQTTLARPSSAAAKTVDIWNHLFFYRRKVELILYRGLERRSGLTAGKESERLDKSSVPQQYRDIISGRRGDQSDREKNADEEFYESVTSSSSDSSSSGDGENGLEGAPLWVIKHREGSEIVRKRQKDVKRKRRLERKQKRRELRGEPLFSLW
ncbi:hypothetical protein FRB90_000218, partial [Tulasnella sp. 427]